jgi:hypothetical protein
VAAYVILVYFRFCDVSGTKHRYCARFQGVEDEIGDLYGYVGT